ncbi:MAG: hypothetical protein JWP35_3569 [Caulobacter sp.]|nr:hypothetical protein [Caulobacter sp.]
MPRAERLLEGLRRSPKTDPQLSDRLVGVRRRMIACGDAEVAAWRIGAGPAVLLVHGWDDDHRLWEPLIDQLTALGRAVIAVDLPGHGFSTATQCSYPYAARALLAVAAALEPGRGGSLVRLRGGHVRPQQRIGR